MFKAVESLKSHGKILVAFVHPAVTSTGTQRLLDLKKSGKVQDVFATDTLQSGFTKTSVIPEISSLYRKT